MIAIADMFNHLGLKQDLSCPLPGDLFPIFVFTVSEGNTVLCLLFQVS